MSQVICLFIGAFVGFMLGYIVRAKNKNSDAVKASENLVEEVIKKAKKE